MTGARTRGARSTARVIAALVLVVALAARLPRATATPGWDGDEGYNLDIAWNLAHGDARMFALEYRFVAHPPLAYALLAPALRAFGRDLEVVRSVSGTCAALATAAVAWGLALAGLPRAAVLGGLALAVAPFAVAYGRMAYTYGVLGLVAALSLAAILSWRRAVARTGGLAAMRGMALASTLAALGPLVDHAGLALPALLAIEARIATRSWLAGAGALAITLVPTILVHATVAWIDPAGASEEWLQIAARVGAIRDPDAMPVPGGLAPTLMTTAALVLANVVGLLRAAWWWPLAVAGLFMLPAPAGRATVLRAFALLALPALAIRPVDPHFRTAIPLLPLAGWGLGALLDRAVAVAFEVAGTVPGRGSWAARFSGSCLAALLLLPLGLEAATTAVAVLPPAATEGLGAPRSPADGRPMSALALPIDPWLVRDSDDARSAAAWVNARTLPSDLVIASPAVTWLIDARVADHLQATARALPGTAVAFYPPVIATARWRFDPSPARARFVILDRLTDAWVAGDEAVRRVIGPISDRTPAYRAGAYRVVSPG